MQTKMAGKIKLKNQLHKHISREKVKYAIFYRETMYKLSQIHDLPLKELIYPHCYLASQFLTENDSTKATIYNKYVKKQKA